MAADELNLGIIGSGGDGVMVAGETIVSAAAREGLRCLMLKSFGPQIRGGESSCKIRISPKKIAAYPDKLDVLVAFDWRAYLRFGNELMLNSGGVVIEEGEDGEPEPDRPLKGCKPESIYRIPLTRLAKDAAGTRLARNMVALGAMSELFSLPDRDLRKSIEKLFFRKSSEVVGKNVRAYEAGKDYVKQHIVKTHKQSLKGGKDLGERLVMTGNDAIAYGALLAGCRFFAGYPITPSSEIMEWFSIYMPAFGGTMIQTEDEMAALGMVLGASLAGKKAMTATSGPGHSLMTEMIGLASLAEIPCVIVSVQRGGPSTGLPTKSEQSDLMHAVYGGHGDAPRVVIAPADVADCFEVMREAFYISEKYQIPVIVLSDGFIGHCKSAIGVPDISRFSVPDRDRPDPVTKDYKRFELTPTGVSKMSIPGLDKLIYRAAGIEHDETGNPTSDFDLHQRMNEKRYRKLEHIAGDVNFMRIYGPREKAKVGVLAWGSSKGTVREAVETLGKQGCSVSALIPQVLFPIAKDKLKAYIDSVESLLVVELSYSRQFLNLLKTQVDLPPDTQHYGRSGGQPLAVSELIEQIKKLL
ncbi:MAG: 2-oxoacid:acceptor oxidoreductase subunit alpha [Gemmatimonadota bacterium]|nr:2-oxoacid:acceptor oxidoreductase subunit alpha [Gemmatimonadota bacterium]